MSFLQKIRNTESRNNTFFHKLDELEKSIEEDRQNDSLGPEGGDLFGITDKLPPLPQPRQSISKEFASLYLDEIQE